MKYNQLVASKLKEMREISQVSLEGAAELLHEHKSTLSKLENGKMNVNVEHLQAYSQLLKMPVISFLPEGSAIVQISNGDGHNINCHTNINNESDPKLMDSLKMTIKYLSKVVNGK